jgi:4-hydroxy-2-oxoheptanedioate aldolase
MDTLRQLWAAGTPTFGGWLAIPSTASAEGAARCGFEYVCVDNQHGVNDYLMTASMIQAILLGGSRPIVRVPWNEPGIIGKMLDAGAEGVVVPMVNSAAEAEAVVQACCYPPRGSRSHGPVLVGLRDNEHHVHAADGVAVIPMIETAEAVRNIDDVLAVPGVNAIYVGPSDLSLSLGLGPGNNDDHQVFTDALTTIVAACKRHGVVPGIHASGALAERRLEMGYQMITVAGDLLSMRTHMRGEIAAARGATAGADGSKSMY